jgi:hypothetical protein
VTKRKGEAAFPPLLIHRYLQGAQSFVNRQFTSPYHTSGDMSRQKLPKYKEILFFYVLAAVYLRNKKARLKRAFKV